MPPATPTSPLLSAPQPRRSKPTRRAAVAEAETLEAQSASLPRLWLRSARRHPWRPAITDLRTSPISFGRALLRALFLARRLRRRWRDERFVALLLPPSAGGALANLAALLCGKTVVNLNYTAGAEALGSALAQCGAQRVLSSREFLKHVSVQIPVAVDYLEEFASRPRTRERLATGLLALLPSGLLLRLLAGGRPASALDLATVIFSSGSTGEPKGVMLTHGNIAANVAQLRTAFALRAGDCILGALPLFHAMGFTVTLFLPALVGFRAVYHANPLDARTIGELARREGVTLLLATPTMLRAYTRACAVDDFRTVRFAFVGAAKLGDEVQRAFETKFGVPALEGYGATECAPVIAVNRPGGRARRGTVGVPLPGVRLRVLELESGVEAAPGSAGVLWVSGANVMQGYYQQPQRTREVLRDGWYNTGDIGSIDAEGFVTLTDRLARLSKIGGEMVPHVKLEEYLNQLAGGEESFAVTSLPDENKGERLVVLHTLPGNELQPVLAQLAESDLPNLWKPRAADFVRVEALPYVATGKLDLRRLRQLAQERVRG